MCDASHNHLGIRGSSSQLEAPTYDTKIGRSPEDALLDRDLPEASLPFRECFPMTMSRRDEESCRYVSPYADEYRLDIKEKHSQSTSARRSELPDVVVLAR
ncbi:hypothetical protein F511_06167 [Dorcoceras hygrometricum]|uniref:Uncharacterized protein n=1 Tax=Dorcoceras hygrometricum TaxID=472368 RepID=A0A2Z7CKW1_9LAMI|nr:hypothetical protein F511_06167 [Dorcoceras hygrometricum]